MTVLVGIDEVGFGPLLGPMVVSSTAISLPGQLAKSNLWQILKNSVANRKRYLRGRLLITDSKKAYNRRKGTGHLERTVLACLYCLDQKPGNLHELLQLLCASSLSRLEGYPWYSNMSDYRISYAKADMEIASAVLKKDLSSQNLQLIGLRSRCLDVGHYNEMVENVKNKANILFTAVSSLIKSAFDQFAQNKLRIIVDRQGGRIHYRSQLQRMFTGMEMKILREDSIASSYLMRAGPREAELHFVVGADNHFLPVSLASMVSKLLRELLVDCINRYFTSFYSELRPTAGYWTDGLRFIKDIRENIPHVQFDSRRLIRSR